MRNVSDWILGHLHAAGSAAATSSQRGGLRVVVRKIRRQKVLEAQVGRVGVAATEAPTTEPTGS